MNEHARIIWQAWLDGKELQCSSDGQETWSDAEPTNSFLPYPHEAPFLWRIKPNKEPRFYRIYFSLSFNRPRIFIQKDYNNISPERFEKVSYFGGWITDWMSYEVEVGE